MQQEQQQTTNYVLDPYKTIGCFVHGPVSISKSTPFAFATACYNSFKIYSSQLAIKLVSPCFNEPIRALHTYNQYTYVLLGSQIIKMKYHHVMNKWVLPANQQNKGKNSVKNNNGIIKAKQKVYGTLLVFDSVIVVSLGSNVYVIQQQNYNNKQQTRQSIFSLDLGINIVQILHPVTYINKVLAYSRNALILFNPISQKILYNYNSLLSQLISQQQGSQITVVQTTPLVDIIAVGLSTGAIHIINIRASKLVFTMKMKNSVTAIAFSQNQSYSYMVSGDNFGNIILWDLENKKILYRLENGFQGLIDKLFFVPGFDLITGTSSKSNQVKQFRINIDDNKTLLIFRQRSGISSVQSIQSFKVHTSKQITFSSQKQTTFSSLYSHSNMYILPHVLDSCLPYHIIAKNFNIELYKQRTNIGKYNVHENIIFAKFSISGKFVIVGTKSRILKISVPTSANKSNKININTVMHVACEWKVQNCNQIVMHKQHFIYAFCFNSIYVLNFNQPTVFATLNQGKLCYAPITNLNQSLLALQNRTNETIQIFGMRSLNLSRQFASPSQHYCSKLIFTPDNRYLLAAYIDNKVKIWSIIQGNLYKNIKLQGKIKDMSFTPDGGYFLTVFENAKQIHIWNNYIGKIVTKQSQQQLYKFETKLNYLTNDNRDIFSKKTDYKNQNIQLQSNDQLQKLLQVIPDTHINEDYNFTNVSKYMSLVYYDEIKSRNSINKYNQNEPSLPFFLDFKNLSEEQAKITSKLREQAREKRDKEKNKIDEQLKNDTHEITLTKKSKQKQYLNTWKMLQKLSVAQIDYQLRSYLIRPGNLQYLIKMFKLVIDKGENANQMLVNILLVRVLQLSGSQICSQEVKNQCTQLLQKINQIIKNQGEVVQRCTAIIAHSN